jgi:hypothetical protein
MGEVTWIEVLSRPRDVAVRQRVMTDTFTIGRAYDNDLVLDDPHVAAHHLRIARDEAGAWTVEDLGSRNGLYVDGDRARKSCIVLDGGTTLRVGQTGLRLRTSAQPVPDEVPLASAAPRWPIALICLAAVLALALLEIWLNETGEPKLVDYLMPLLVLAGMTAVWTAIWSLLSRLFSGHAQFGRHLLIVSVGLLVYTVYDHFSELGAFALSWTALARYVYVGAWIAFAAVCFMHLRALGKSRLPLKAAVVIVLAALGITMQSLKQSDLHSNYGQPVVLRRLEPPWLRLVPLRSQSDFLAASADLKTHLDKARSETPTGGDALESDD